MEFLSKKHNKNIYQQVVIFDLKDLTYSLDTRTLSVFSQCTTMDNKYYPERLHRCYMINAPWYPPLPSPLFISTSFRYFTAIWSLLQPFIDPVTRQKIRILGSNFLEELREVLDDNQIPVEYGGKWQDIRWSWPYPEESGCSPTQISEYNERRGEFDKNLPDSR